jgi:hypothetical protein
MISSGWTGVVHCRHVLTEAAEHRIPSVNDVVHRVSTAESENEATPLATDRVTMDFQVHLARPSRRTSCATARRRCRSRRRRASAWRA